MPSLRCQGRVAGLAALITATVIAASAVMFRATFASVPARHLNEGVVGVGPVGDVVVAALAHGIAMRRRRLHARDGIGRPGAALAHVDVELEGEVGRALLRVVVLPADPVLVVRPQLVGLPLAVAPLVAIVDRRCRLVVKAGAAMRRLLCRRRYCPGNCDRRRERRHPPSQFHRRAPKSQAKPIAIGIGNQF